MQELREQVTTMLGVMQRQEARLEQLQGFVERQAAAVAAAATESRDPLAPSARAPEAAEGEGVVAVSVAAVPPPTSAPPTASGSATLDTTADEVERERALTALMKFMKFKPPTFEKGKVEPSAVKSWVDSMETLFEDLYTPEKDKVPFATHCLDKAAKVWWKRLKRDRPSDLPPMLWEEFKRKMFGNYFPDTEKRKLKKKFRKLRQGDRSVADYEQEFSHIIDCVPDVVKDDADRAEWFLRGLRPWIYRAVQLFQLRTFAEVFNKALWAEHGDAHVREERELLAGSQDKGKKRPGGSSGCQSSSKRPPKYPRSQSWGRGPQRCPICGDRGHRAPQCRQRQGRCFNCGQEGHISRDCSARASSTPSVASTPAPPPYQGGPHMFPCQQGVHWRHASRR
uniref:CCHC-type domain-containing protein n=1 Tax=Ananas comosus var. bracteatus TaxID=296719 RepID=A0A6V7PZZ3_ANACO|nr:unnamed protein product [Ananas comosus var. bracteatus]